jgi:hypothetical protein
MLRYACTEYKSGLIYAAVDTEEAAPMTLLVDRPAAVPDAPATPPQPPAPVPAWDPLRDPLWVTEALQWLTDALAYLLVARETERYAPAQLPEGLRPVPGEQGDQDDRERLQTHTQAMGELWTRLVRLYGHYEAPIFAGPPEAAAAAVASLHRPGLWPESGAVSPEPPAAGSLNSEEPIGG